MHACTSSSLSRASSVCMLTVHSLACRCLSWRSRKPQSPTLTQACICGLWPVMAVSEASSKLTCMHAHACRLRAATTRTAAALAGRARHGAAGMERTPQRTTSRMRLGLSVPRDIRGSRFSGRATGMYIDRQGIECMLLGPGCLGLGCDCQSGLSCMCVVQVFSKR